MRAAVVDPDLDRILGFYILNPHHSAKRQGTMGGGVEGFVVQFSTGCFASMKFIRIIGSHADFTVMNGRKQKKSSQQFDQNSSL